MANSDKPRTVHDFAVALHNAWMEHARTRAVSPLDKPLRWEDLSERIQGDYEAIARFASELFALGLT